MRITDNVILLSGSCYAAINQEALLGEVYGVRAPQGLILVDCGEPKSGLVKIRETLDYYGIQDKITYLILTHAHHDHCGNAKALQDMGVKVIISEEDSLQCTNGGPRGMDTPYDDDTYFDFEPFTPDIEIKVDCEMDLSGLSVQFIKIPGHTRGSMAVKITIDRKTILFTGDALQPQGGGLLDDVSFGWTGDIGYDRTEIIRSMMKLRHIQTDMILPGHGKICLDNGTELLRFAACKAHLTLR